MLRTALEERGIAWADLISAQPVGGSILRTLGSALAEADFVCGIVPSQGDNLSVLFELGFAYRRRQAILVFVESDVKMPPELQEVVYARAGLRDEEALNFHLDAFLQHARRPIEHRDAPPSHLKPTDASWAIDALQHLEDATVDSPVAAAEFEDLVARVSSKRREPSSDVRRIRRRGGLIWRFGSTSYRCNLAQETPFP